jgi:hypothetical protein
MASGSDNRCDDETLVRHWPDTHSWPEVINALYWNRLGEGKDSSR